VLSAQARRAEVVVELVVIPVVVMVEVVGVMVRAMIMNMMRGVWKSSKRQRKKRWASPKLREVFSCHFCV
jgi:hypothetical protein